MPNEIRIGIDKIEFEDNELGDIRTLKELSEGSHSAHASRHTEGGDDEIPGLVHPSGWISAGETWTYASATTFTISGDKTGKYSVGMKIKLTQTSAKYFYISAISYSSPNTTITVNGMGLYTVANATITSPYYSTVHSPQSFPIKMIPGNVKARIYLSSHQLNLVSGVLTKVLLDGEHYDAGDDVDIENNRVIIPVTGDYSISAQITWIGSSLVADKAYLLVIRKNGLDGTELIGNWTHASLAHYLANSVSDTIHLTVNDYIELYATQYSGVNTVDIYGSVDGRNTLLTIHLASV